MKKLGQKIRAPRRVRTSAGLRQRSADGSYSDANPTRAARNSAEEPTWYTFEPGTLLITKLPLDVSKDGDGLPIAVVGNSTKEAEAYGYPPALYQPGTAAMFVGLERVIIRSKSTLRPFYILGSAKLIMRPEYVDLAPES